MFCETSVVSCTVLVNETINIPVSLTGLWLNKAAAPLGKSRKPHWSVPLVKNKATLHQLCFLNDSLISAHFFTLVFTLAFMVEVAVSNLTATHELYIIFVYNRLFFVFVLLQNAKKKSFWHRTALQTHQTQSLFFVV